MDKLLWPTGKVNRRSTRDSIQKAINETVEVLQAEYDRSGKIGNKTPADWDDAWMIAYELAYDDARRHAGSKVPERNFENPVASGKKRKK